MRSFAGFLMIIWLVCLQGCASLGGPDVAHKPTRAAVWIDVRTEGEYQAGHVDKAINIPYEDIAEGITALQLASDQPIYLYCGSGRRAGIALETLASLGYTRLTNVGSLENALQWPSEPQAQSPAPSNAQQP